MKTNKSNLVGNLKKQMRAREQPTNTHSTHNKVLIKYYHTKQHDCQSRKTKVRTQANKQTSKQT